jgi:tetratricopeptide (TPR) repeat protein
MDEAAKAADSVLKVLPDLPEAHFCRAMAHLSLGRYESAEASIRAVQSSAEANRYPRTHFMLANVLAQKGDVANAAAEFRRFLELEPSSRAADAARQQLAEWQAAGLLK